VIVRGSAWQIYAKIQFYSNLDLEVCSENNWYAALSQLFSPNHNAKPEQSNAMGSK